MSGVLVRFAFKTAGNVECSVGMKIIAVSCVQTCVSEFVTYCHFLRCVAEFVIQYNIFSSQYVYQKSSYIIGQRKPYDRYAEIARKLERVSRAVFVDEILDTERNVHRLHLFCGGDYR